MNTVLLVLVILNGQAQGFAVATDSTSQCIELETTITLWLPKFLGNKPEFYAAQCTEVKPFPTAL